MLIDRYADDVVVWAPAKVNLYLEILGKRADGYHELATLMVAVRLYDTLVFRDSQSGDVRLRCSDPALSTGTDNLVVRAAQLLQKHASCQRGADIRLIKRIPLAAGLAGGSTDAAATLAGLNRLWKLNLTREVMDDLAAQLGSDVPFFLAGPAAWCTGRGEKVEATPLGKTLDLVLACPGEGLSTAEVYRNVEVPKKPETGDGIRKAVEAGKIEDIGRLLFNRLQPAAEKLCPAISQIQARLEKFKPAGTLMSGSGTSVFAVCRNRLEAQAVARQLRHGKEGAIRIFRVRSCS
jgi:4-diphosphocytidyl-2-C-methyl-D-erythritol kinase